MSRAQQAYKFWNASHFYRRSGKADRTLAVKILEQVAADADGILKDRAISLLVDIDNEQLQRARG
jgi:hypothetical protein